MKKLSNELKVGIIAFVTIIAFVWLFNFLKGKDLFSSTKSYYVVYNEIGGLTETNPVEISGYKAGVVQSISFINDRTGRLLVKLSVDKTFSLPVNSVAEITPASLIAGMKIRILMGDGQGFYESGDTIPGRFEISIIKKVEDELMPVKEKLTALITNLDSVMVAINDIMTPAFTSDVKGTMADLRTTAGSFKQMVTARDSGLNAIVADISRFSEMLSKNSDAMGSTISNLKTITDSIAAADLYSTVLNLRNTLGKTATILEGLNEGKGTAGQVLTNDSLYVNLNSSMKSLDQLLQDLKANPKRYVHFSIFGKKAK
ncbi:MAG: MlaD family protein [Bacteroidales bacterium]